MRVIVVAALLLLPQLAAAQEVLPAGCPAGYVHQGDYCVRYGGGGIVRVPFGRFMHHRPLMLGHGRGHR